MAGTASEVDVNGFDMRLDANNIEITINVIDPVNSAGKNKHSPRREIKLKLSSRN